MVWDKLMSDEWFESHIIWSKQSDDLCEAHVIWSKQTAATEVTKTSKGFEVV